MENNIMQITQDFIFNPKTSFLNPHSYRMRAHDMNILKAFRVPDFPFWRSENLHILTQSIQSLHMLPYKVSQLSYFQDKRKF